MKKYLMIGFVAAVAFSSCSKNDFVTTTQADIDKAKYDQAFRNYIGGAPAANQDWGFGSGTRAFTRANAVITGDPFTYETTDGYYKSGLPAEYLDINTASDYECLTSGKALVATSDIRENLNLYSRPLVDIYINGNVTLPSGAYIHSANIYVLPGATLTMNKQANYECNIFVSATGTLNYNLSNLQTNPYWENGETIHPKSHLYNRGIVYFAENFEANNDVVVYNENIMYGTNITSKPGDGNPSYFYNFGDLNLEGDMILNSKSNFLNEGNVSVAGLTEATQQNIWWINKGHYTSGTLDFMAYNKTFYNFCNLIVEGHASMYTGEFNLMDNSYTEVGSANLGKANFKVNMGNGTGFNVKGNLVIEANGDGTQQGFFAAAGAKSYLRVEGDVTVAEHMYSLILDGDITYAFNGELIDLGASNSGVQPTYVFGSSTTAVPAADFSKFYATAKTNDCGATWNVPGTDPDPNVLRIVAEDLTATQASDFDFNDVVLDVTLAKNGNTFKVMLVAAGGTLPLRVGGAAGVEVHEALLGAANAKNGNVYKMVSPGGDVWPITAVDITNYITDKNIQTPADANTKISIEVYKNGEWQLLTAPQGESACKLGVDQTYTILNERQSIKTVYPNFVEWATLNTISKWW